MYISQGWLAFILYSNARVKDLKVFIMQQVFFRPVWPSRPDLISRSVQHTKEGSSTGRMKVVSM